MTTHKYPERGPLARLTYFTVLTVALVFVAGVWALAAVGLVSLIAKVLTGRF
jgi:hypothetical protein